MLWILAAEEHHENGFFFPGDMKEFWYGSAAFLIVLGLFIWKGLPVIKQMYANRTKRIEEELSVAERAQAEADARIAEQQAKFANQDAEAREIVQAAHDQADRLKADLAARTDAELVAMRSRAEAEVVSMRSQASADIQLTMSSRALQAAEAVVQDNLDDATQVELVEQYIQQLGAAS